MVSRISKLSAIRKASRWQKLGIKWHFHLLSPGCLFNPTKIHELFVESKFGSFVVRSHKPLTEICRHLVQILHGKSIVKYPTSPSNARLKTVLQQAKRLTKKKVKWHHHLLFPHCVFNKKPGKWVLAFEDPLENKLTELVYPHLPQSDLDKVMRLFHAQH